MSLSILFWFLMILWAIFGAWGWRDPAQPFVRGGGWFLTFVLLAILGWAVFGAAIRG
jgi:hypothetical protein